MKKSREYEVIFSAAEKSYGLEEPRKLSPKFHLKSCVQRARKKKPPAGSVASRNGGVVSREAPRARTSLINKKEQGGRGG